MDKSTIVGLCATMALVIGGTALAAETPHPKVYRPQMLPQLYVAADQAQAACPDDQVVWVNWSARTSHLPADKYYGHTETGAYACAKAAAKAGIKPAS
ncbi:MAG TPA: hypothetical protein VKQ29_06640 [Aliidongia sp.]|nr:hypothetical protein [Aliidongia sp.]